MRTTFLTITILLLSTTLSAQKDSKIEKQLSKLFTKGKYEKCHSKALKLNKKYPKSIIPEYYISKVALHRYATTSIDNKSHYRYLSQAVNYSKRLPDDYNEWKAIIQDSIKGYIYYLHDSIPKSRKLSTAIKLYSKTYSVTLVFSDVEELAERVSVYEFSQSTIDSLRMELVKFAELQDGIRYKYAGEKPETGFDCSGFTMYVYGHIGIELPHNAHKQSNLEGVNKSLDEAAPGDLIFFGSQNENSHYTVHAGIVHSVYEEDIEVIHCVSGGVSIDGRNSSWEHYWKDKVLFVKTLPTLTETHYQARN